MRDIYNEDQSPGTPEAKQNFFQCLAGCGPSQNYFNFINLIPSRLGPGCCPFSCFTLLFLCIISRTLSLVLLFVLYSKSWHYHIWTASCYLYVNHNIGFFFWSTCTCSILNFFFQSIFSPLSMVLCEWFCLFSYLLFIGFHITVLYIFITLNSNIYIYIFFLHGIKFTNKYGDVYWMMIWLRFGKVPTGEHKICLGISYHMFWKKKKKKSKSLYFQFHNAFFDFSGTNCKR